MSRTHIAMISTIWSEWLGAVKNATELTDWPSWGLSVTRDIAFQSSHILLVILNKSCKYQIKRQKFIIKTRAVDVIQY